MSRPSPIVTVTLDPAIDMTVELEYLERGRANIGNSVTQQASGKGVNVAAYLTDWQMPVIATGLLGDANAELFEALFARKGVVGSFCRVPGTGRTSIKISDQADGRAADINLPGIDAAPANFDTLCDRIDALADITGTALCGSLTGGLSPDVYVGLLARLDCRGIPTLADTSGAPLAQVLAAPRDELPTAIKPNRHELELWAGTSLSTLAETVGVARVVHTRGVAQVIVLLGGGDTLFVTVDGTWQASLPPVRATSTAGAGNAMVTDVLVGWHAGTGTEETVCPSVASAAYKLRRLGPHLPAPGEVYERTVAVQMQRVARNPGHCIASPHAQRIQGADYGKPAGNSRRGRPHHPRDARQRGPAPRGT